MHNDHKVIDGSSKRFSNDQTTTPKNFIVSCILLFLLFYGFNIAFIGITSPGGLYLPFLDHYGNYIRAWRTFTVSGTASILTLLCYQVSYTDTQLYVQNHSGFTLVYSCLGYGIMSSFTAFVISYPDSRGTRIKTLACGLFLIQLLNFLRLILLALFWKKSTFRIIDHHTIFNVFLYLILLLYLNNRLKNAA